MPFEFTTREGEPLTLDEAAGQAVGAASMCWENMSGTGTFQSERAQAIVEALLGFIRDTYDLTPKRTAVPDGEEVKARSRWRPVDPQGRPREVEGG